MRKKSTLFFLIFSYTFVITIIGGEKDNTNRYWYDDNFKRFFELKKTINLSQEKNLIARIRQFSIGPDDNFYLLDSKKIFIYKYDPFGNFISSIGGVGQGPGEFIQPLGFCLGKENIYIVDPMARKASVFSLNGEFKYFFSIQDGRMVKEGKNGEIIIAAPLIFKDSISSCIHIYDKKGNRIRSFLPINKNAIKHGLISDGVNFDLDQDGNIYSIQEMEYKIHLYKVTGQHMKTFFEKKSYYTAPPAKAIDKTNLRSEMEKWLKSWTHISGIYIYNDLLFVVLSNFNNLYKFVLDIYKTDGNFIKGGLMTNYIFLCPDKKGYFYFLKEENNVGNHEISYTILIYDIRKLDFH